MEQLSITPVASCPSHVVNIPTRELRSFHMDGQVFIDTIKRELHELAPQIPSAEQMADRLFISSRTFSRRLSNAGQDYRSIVSEVRRSVAIEQLTGSGEKISVIARHLGYADTSNFTKAFKIWTGLSPKNYRKAHKN
ncbi:MAG: AraC family transcriptional regulator [Pseudomonadota bacterium]|nr:AraC family transcriptional regulator [Pseudomonadota bacterium]